MSALTWLTALPWFAWVAIVAILIGGINQIVKAILTHNERMEKIRHGLDPDASQGPVGSKSQMPEL